MNNEVKAEVKKGRPVGVGLFSFLRGKIKSPPSKAASRKAKGQTRWLPEGSRYKDEQARLFLCGVGQGQEDAVVDGDGAGENCGRGGAGDSDGLRGTGNGGAGGFGLQGTGITGDE
jgi:hypothetical protein